MRDPGRYPPGREQERPANQAEKLHHAGGDTEGGRDRQVGRVPTRQGLVDHDRQRHEQHGGEHEPVPDGDEAAVARVEPSQDVANRFAQNTRVLEGHR
jgi:hypothetical protein